jgi:hypothetical protein
MNDGMDRRDFLKYSVATGAILAAGGATKDGCNGAR